MPNQTKGYSSGTHNREFINTSVFSVCAYDSFVCNYKQKRHASTGIALVCFQQTCKLAVIYFGIFAFIIVYAKKESEQFCKSHELYNFVKNRILWYALY